MPNMRHSHNRPPMPRLVRAWLRGMTRQFAAALETQLRTKHAIPYTPEGWGMLLKIFERAAFKGNPHDYELCIVQPSDDERDARVSPKIILKWH